MLTSSFKTASEIFAVPIQWFPSLPPRVASSPYIVEDAYPKIVKPEGVDETTWAALQPELTQAIWTAAEAYIAARFSNYVPSEKLQAEMTEGLWQQLAASLPNEIWHEPKGAIVNTVQDAVIAETIETIWSSVYREVAIGTLQIEDLDFNRPELGPVAWEARGDSLLRPSADPRTEANLFL